MSMKKLNWFILIRAFTYATIFIGLILVYLPDRIMSGLGVVRPSTMGIFQIIGILTGILGAIIAFWCILSFATIGKGTPAPFDPPSQLVIQGPYRYVRNPLYLGAAITIIGTASYFESWILIAYAVIFLMLLHVFVVWYEEPTLRQTFGGQYEAYCRKVHRWWPTFTGREENQVR
jgi:protein-S-isoprenylcysteine O-methyltransferase Ste14